MTGNGGNPPRKRPYHGQLLTICCQHTRVHDILEAAKTAGLRISQRTIERWRANWGHEVTAARAVIEEETLLKLRDLASLVTDKLRETVLKADADPLTVRAAFSAVFTAKASQVSSVEQDARITRIEQRLGISPAPEASTEELEDPDPRVRRIHEVNAATTGGR